MLHHNTPLDFWAKVDMSGGPDACWPWTAGRYPRGYGFFKFHGKMRRTHVLAYTLTHGPIEPGLLICHSCDNPPCCNPAHLWPGSCLDNHRDRNAKLRQASGDRNGSRTMPERLARGETNPNAKLTAEKVRLIRGVYAQTNASYAELGVIFEVTKPTIAAIILRETWRHVH